jgi:hypothetical protein
MGVDELCCISQRTLSLPRHIVGRLRPNRRTPSNVHQQRLDRVVTKFNGPSQYERSSLHLIFNALRDSSRFTMALPGRAALPTARRVLTAQELG